MRSFTIKDIMDLEFIHIILQNMKNTNETRKNLKYDVIYDMVPDENGVYVESRCYHTPKTSDLTEYDAVYDMVLDENGVYVENAYYHVQKTSDLTEEETVSFDRRHADTTKINDEDILETELNEDNEYVVIDK